MSRAAAPLGIGALLLFALAAQEPSSLEQHFQGRPAKILLDMPGDDSGIDVHAGNPAPVHADIVKERLDKYGPGLRRGQLATITLVKHKGDHIELQLDGGGFTNRQLIGLPGYDSIHWGTSEEERRVRSSMIGTRDKARRRRLESEYDSLRRRRIRPLRDKLEREQRASHGSRFNIHFSSGREASQITAEELTVLLRPYIELQ